MKWPFTDASHPLNTNRANSCLRLATPFTFNCLKSLKSFFFLFYTPFYILPQLILFSFFLLFCFLTDKPIPILTSPVPLIWVPPPPISSLIPGLLHHFSSYTGFPSSIHKPRWAPWQPGMLAPEYITSACLYASFPFILSINFWQAVHPAPQLPHYMWLAERISPHFWHCGVRWQGLITTGSLYRENW